MKKFRLFIKDLLFANNRPAIRNTVSALLFCLSLILLDAGFRFIYREAVASLFGDGVAFGFTICWTAILTALSFLLPRLARRIYQILVPVIYAVFAVAHAFFYSFQAVYMTLSSTIFASDGAAFFDWSYFTVPKKFIALILVCVFLSVISALILPKTKYSLLRVSIPVLVFALGIGGTFVLKACYIDNDEGFVAWDSTRSPQEIYESFTDSRVCLHTVGLYQYTFRDVANVTGLSELWDRLSSGDAVEELNEYYENKETDPDNEMTGIFKDKNLILIQLESIDTWMVNDVSMPYFSALQKESINFENFYAPKFLVAATFNTETIVNTGLITPSNSAKLSYFTDNSYPYSAANLFKEAGYSAESFHSSNGKIYNRGSTHINWGYTAYNDGASMGMKNTNLDTHLMAGYDRMVSDEKFMSFVITYSGHGPYNGKSVEVSSYYDIIKPQVPENSKEEYIWALCHAYETDRFIELLCNRLEADGLMDDTVLIFYSDHYDHYVNDSSILVDQKGPGDSNEWSKIPFVIYHKGTEAMTVEKTVSSFDILPTIVNLFDLNTDGRYYVGNDAFSENGGYAFFQNNSWIENGTYFDVNESTPSELSRKRNEEISLRMEMNYETVSLDYFRRKAE